MQPSSFIPSAIGSSEKCTWSALLFYFCIDGHIFAKTFVYSFMALLHGAPQDQGRRRVMLKDGSLSSLKPMLLKDGDPCCHVGDLRSVCGDGIG